MDKATVVQLVDHVQYAADAVVSKTLVDRKTGTLTLFAFDAGQGLSEHTVPFDALVQVLDGEVEVTVAGEIIPAATGTLVVMPANVPHSLRAVQRFKMLLTMIRS